MATISIKGIKEFENAVKRNPNKAVKEADLFLTRGMALYKQGILRDPWGLFSSGGGAPVDTGNLRDTHMTVVNGKLSRAIGPKAKYAQYVHQGTSRMKARPWLDYVKESKDRDVQNLYRKMLSNIVSDLAK